MAKVSFSGLIRTKDDYIHRTLCDLYDSVSTVESLIAKTKEVRETLQGIGAFKEVKCKIDVVSDSKHDYHVKFVGTESGRLKGNIGTEINQCGATTHVQLESPNVLGRGERIEANVSNTNSTMNSEQNWGFNVKLLKPFLHTRHGKYKPWTSVHLFGTNTRGYQKSYNLYSRGAIFDFSFMPTEHQLHSLQYELAYRELGFNSRQVPLFVREHFGPRLGSFLRYIAQYDDRTTKIFPNQGTFFRLCAEKDIFGEHN